MKVAIIGGGAAGFFSAINVKYNYPKAQVVIFEKTSKLLSKVKISGGGRCNLTHACYDIDALIKYYPRGKRFLKHLFYRFNPKDTQNWFEHRGVDLEIQSDNCIFPKTQNSQSIIDLFLSETEKLKIEIKLQHEIISIINKESQLELFFFNDSKYLFDKVILSVGGLSNIKKHIWSQSIDHNITTPIPSLFTFNMPDENITSLMGIVVKNTKIRIQSTKHEAQGPLLITHWGMSGPVIISLSSYAAIELYKKNYQFNISVNWINEKNVDLIKNYLKLHIRKNKKKQIGKSKIYDIPQRLWVFLLEKSDISSEKRWEEIGNKNLNILIESLTNDSYTVSGQSKYKEEFVTCGGIDLTEINVKTMQSKKINNLYFAGEVLNIDGLTGGFNFQAAWTTAFIAAQLK